MNETYMPRMPQVGERWRLRIRPGESICPVCKHEEGIEAVNNPTIQGSEVIIQSIERLTHCGNCDAALTKNGYYGISLTNRLGRPGAVPYTWLEPLEAQP